MDTAVELSPAARMWGQPGAAYDGISFGLSDTISHAVQLLWPRPGERVLDIGTGTGWAARLAARRGARVTAVDIAPGMLKAAEQLSDGLEPRPAFLQASAEALPFDDAAFDGVMSTYGVIFADDPSATIDEMARVLRPGGRMALATWADEPEGYIARFFALVARWSEAPPPPASPFQWGRPDWLARPWPDASRSVAASRRRCSTRPTQRRCGRSTSTASGPSRPPMRPCRRSAAPSFAPTSRPCTAHTRPGSAL